MFDCRIVILNYNGRTLLETCLPSIIDAAKASKYRCRVTILDNQSVDDSEAWVNKTYAEDVDYVKSPKNRVYCSYNDYLKVIREPYVILLNNDIRVDPRFIDPLLDALIEDERCFLVAPQSKNVREGFYEGNLSKMEMRYGLLWGSSYFSGYEKKINQKRWTM